MVQLPPIESTDGILTRMLIAECRNPGHPEYDEMSVKQGMGVMKAVVDNRLHNNPIQFNAPGAQNYIDIITAPGQWHGFSRNANGTVVIAPDIQTLIDTVISIANTGQPGLYHKFVENILEVAAAPVNDPFKPLSSIDNVSVIGGAYSWRTEGSTSPGGSFVAIPPAPIPPLVIGGLIAGNQFYTLKSA